MTDADIKLAQKYLKSLQDLLTKEEVANKGLFIVYTPLPTSPTLTTPVTIIPSDQYATGFYNATLLGASKNANLVGNFADGFNFRDAVGSAGTPIILLGAADYATILGSGSLTTHGFQTNNNAPDYVQLHRVLLRSSTQNGIQLGTKSTGSHFVISDVVIDTPGASGSTFNFGISGTNYYESIDVSFLRSFNAGQEGIIYIGNTGASYDGTNYINTATVHDCFSYNSSREGTQYGHINTLLSYKNTVINSGQTGGAGQNGLIQIHDCNGTVRDSIYDGAPEFGTLFTHGTTISNCYFRWTNNNPIFVGRSDNAYFAAFANRLNGQPLLFDSCIFHCDNVGTLAQVATIEERTANIEFRNCIFSNNITALYLDNRVAGYSNSLIGTISTNGNSKTAITAPTYTANYNVYSNYSYHGLCNSTTYRQLHMGYRQKG